jgi:choline kinase
LLATHSDAALLIEPRAEGQAPYGDEEMKVKVRDGLVVDMSKAMDPAEADGENLGIVKFGPNSAPRLVAIMDRIIGEGRVRDWAPKAFRDFAQSYPLAAVGTNGLPWIEIDFPEDYDRAIRDVLPSIDGHAVPAEDVA